MTRLLPAFRFEIKLRKSAQAESGFGVALDIDTATVADDENSLGDGAFQECSGLEVEMDVQEYLEGGRNDGVTKRVGRAKYSNIVLKRGMFYGAPESQAGAADVRQLNTELWSWLQKIVSGERPVARYDGVIDVWDREGSVIATWLFDRGLPAKIRGPELNAKTGEIAIEELHIAHEGLRLERGRT